MQKKNFIIASLLFFFTIGGFIYLNYKYIFKSVQEEKTAPTILNTYDPNYQWQFKTLYYSKPVYFNETKKSEDKKMFKEFNSIIENKKEDIYFTFVPYGNENDGKFKFEALYKSEIGKLEKDISEGNLYVKLMLLPPGFNGYQYIQYDEIKNKYPSSNKLAEALFIKKPDDIQEYNDGRLDPQRNHLHIYSSSACRVTYVLNTNFNIWVPCFVTYYEKDFIDFTYDYKAPNGRTILAEVVYLNNATSNNFPIKWVEKETNKTIDMSFLLTPQNEILIKDIIPKDKIELETTENEKEMAKTAFANYENNKTVWDENPKAHKYKEIVRKNGQTYFKLPFETPIFPDINNEK